MSTYSPTTTNDVPDHPEERNRDSRFQGTLAPGRKRQRRACAVPRDDGGTLGMEAASHQPGHGTTTPTPQGPRDWAIPRVLDRPRPSSTSAKTRLILIAQKEKTRASQSTSVPFRGLDPIATHREPGAARLR